LVPQNIFAKQQNKLKNKVENVDNQTIFLIALRSFLKERGVRSSGFKKELFCHMQMAKRAMA
jgi:hypothetical protein